MRFSGASSQRALQARATGAMARRPNPQLRACARVRAAAQLPACAARRGCLCARPLDVRAPARCWLVLRRHLQAAVHRALCADRALRLQPLGDSAFSSKTKRFVVESTGNGPDSRATRTAVGSYFMLARAPRPQATRGGRRVECH